MRIANLIQGQTTLVQASAYNHLTLDVDSAVVSDQWGRQTLLHGTVQLWIGKKGRTASGYNGGVVRHQSKITVHSVIIAGVTHVLDQTI